jgi:hypothetical protein
VPIGRAGAELPRSTLKLTRLPRTNALEEPRRVDDVADHPTFELVATRSFQAQQPTSGAVSSFDLKRDGSRPCLLATLLANSHCPCMTNQIEFLGRQPASMLERARILRQIARATPLISERKQILALAKQIDEEASSLEQDGTQAE